jgi:hypothetical protein
VGLIPVLVRVNNRIRATWIDHHVDSEILPTLINQERQLVHFYTGQEVVPRRTIEIGNGLAGFAADALAAIKQRPPWTIFEFTLVKENTCDVFPESRDLWEALDLSRGWCYAGRDAFQPVLGTQRQQTLEFLPDGGHAPRLEDEDEAPTGVPC